MAGFRTFACPRTILRGLQAAAALLALVAAPHAWAVIPTPTGFKLDISPSARVLDALDMKRDGEISAADFMDIQMDESCDNPHLRIRARNKPAIMITNGPASAAPITTFTLAINEGPYAFGTGDVVGDNFNNYIKNTIYTDPGVSITSSSVSADLKTLTVNFDGLTADKKAIFNVDLDTTDPNYFMYPDYRLVLFGAPGDGKGVTDPATATATFTNATPAPNSKTLTINFPQETEEPEYFETDIRSYQAMDTMEVTSLGIPEPSGAALAVLGLAGIAMRGRKSRHVG